jgi:uncharacterized damage-inducible protein DinB
MSETTARLFRHSAWASQRVYEAVQELPLEALDAYISDPEWSVGRLLQHIVGGADWYVYCLTGAALSHQEKPSSMADIKALAQELAGYDQVIASHASLPDEYLTIKENEKSWQNLRSTILAEAIYHAAEHRTQLIDALESRGFKTISLDSLDLWSFESWEKKNQG